MLIRHLKLFHALGLLLGRVIALLGPADRPVRLDLLSEEDGLAVHRAVGHADRPKGVDGVLVMRRRRNKAYVILFCGELKQHLAVVLPIGKRKLVVHDTLAAERHLIEVLVEVVALPAIPIVKLTGRDLEAITVEEVVDLTGLKGGPRSFGLVL